MRSMKPSTEPLWKYIVLWLMYAEMPRAWFWYLAVVLVGVVYLPWLPARIAALVVAELIIWYHVPPEERLRLRWWWRAQRRWWRAWFRRT
jgi:hypothetical protein